LLEQVTQALCDLHIDMYQQMTRIAIILIPFKIGRDDVVKKVIFRVSCRIIENKRNIPNF
jgi:hypothetical protein